MGAVEHQLTIAFTLRDPRKGAKVGEADFDRLALDLEKRLPVERWVTSPDRVPGAVEHSHPVRDEMPLARRSVLELTGQGRRTAAAHPMAHHQDFPHAKHGDRELERGRHAVK